MPASLSDTAKSSEFVIAREFDASRALVWQMWTEPKYLIHRVAPPGFTATVHKIDVRAGGAFHIAMRSSDGVEFHITGTYREVIPLQRLIYVLNRSLIPPEAEAERKRSPDVSSSTREALHTVTFDDLPGKTCVTISIGFDSEPDRDAMLQTGGDKAMSSSLDRVAELLAKLQSS